MQLIQNKLPAKKSLPAILGILILLLGAIALLWSGRAGSNQATSAMLAQIYFEGEYRIEDDPWQPITEAWFLWSGSTHPEPG